MRPDRWLVVSVRVPSEELSGELAEGLLALGGGAVEEERDLLTTYVPEPGDPNAFLAGAGERLSTLVGQRLEVLWRWEEDRDWSARWKDGLAPRVVGTRVTVTQPWNRVDEEGGGVVIVIDPSNAFGTGEHATTRGALRLMESELAGGERVLDVGTGSGILAIAAARLGAGEVLAVESDVDAMETAAENVARNGVESVVRLENQMVDRGYLEREGHEPFDLVVANVLSGILVPLLPALRESVRPGAGVILGGIMDSEAAEVTAAAGAAGLALEREDREEEWWTALFRRPG